MAFSKVLTVTQISTYLKSIIEDDKVLSSVFLTGEISNFVNHYRSGHFYFTLKDESALIKCVMFKGSAQRVRFEPYNGMKVILHGKISLYEKDGQYQLYVDTMHPNGEGALNLAFEQLKSRLSGLGMFDEKNKKKIPEFPQKIGVITSQTGAAIKDILTVLGRRYPCADVYFLPTQVQGEFAAMQIANAIEKMNNETDVDVIIIGRGGGSLEELWAFNEECVAKSIFNSVIPIISAVGHETDFTISDFVADVRAATPSVAAELATPDAIEQKIKISYISNRMLISVKQFIDLQREYIKRISVDIFSNPIQILNKRKLISHKLENELINRFYDNLLDEKLKFSGLCQKLDAMSPLKVLSRGYSIVSKKNRIIKSVNDLKPKDEVKVLLFDGYVICNVEESGKN